MALDMVAGHYEQKQLLSRSRVIAWSHGARFRLARALVQPYAGKRLLDYGCGDGTFLKGVSDLFPIAKGADVADDQVEDCRSRISNHEFTHTDKIEGRFDVITCMEVLEHCTGEVARGILHRLKSLLAPGGVVVISVPVEIGLVLVAKQSMRRIAGWRGIGDYKWNDSYSPRELLKMVFATKHTSIERPMYDGSHTHKGFNWRSLEAEIKQTFEIRERRFSPSVVFRSQVWFVCETTNVPAT